MHQLVKEKEERQSDIEDLLTEKMQIQEELQSKVYTSFVACKQEQVVSVIHQGKVVVGIESKMRKLEDVIKVFSSAKAELERTVSEKATQLESMEANLTRKVNIQLLHV